MNLALKVLYKIMLIIIIAVTDVSPLLGVRAHLSLQEGFRKDFVGCMGQVLCQMEEGLNVGLEVEAWVKCYGAVF